MSASGERGHTHVADAEPTGDAPAGAARQEREGDALPVLAEQPRVLEVRAVHVPAPAGQPGVLIPIAQAAAAAAGGFVAGAAVVGLVRRRQRRAAPAKLRRGASARRSQAGGRSGGRAAELVQIVGTRSLLVDVHLLGER